MKRLFRFFSLLLISAILWGCGGPKRPEGLPELFGCVLTFQMEDGSPLTGASVSLVPETTANAQWSFSGTTNDQGIATISAHGDFPGAPAGKYKIVLRKADIVETGKVDEIGNPITEVRTIIGAKFSNAAETPLLVEIQNQAVGETFKVSAK